MVIDVLNMATSPLSSFSHIKNIVELLPPFCESIFPVEALDVIYKQLYPCSIVSFLSPFYQGKIIY